MKNSITSVLVDRGELYDNINGLSDMFQSSNRETQERVDAFEKELDRASGIVRELSDATKDYVKFAQAEHQGFDQRINLLVQLLGKQQRVQGTTQQVIVMLAIWNAVITAMFIMRAVGAL